MRFASHFRSMKCSQRKTNWLQTWQQKRNHDVFRQMIYVCEINAKASWISNDNDHIIALNRFCKFSFCLGFLPGTSSEANGNARSQPHRIKSLPNKCHVWRNVFNKPKPNLSWDYKSPTTGWQSNDNTRICSASKHSVSETTPAIHDKTFTRLFFFSGKTPQQKRLQKLPGVNVMLLGLGGFKIQYGRHTEVGSPLSCCGARGPNGPMGSLGSEAAVVWGGRLSGRSPVLVTGICCCWCSFRPRSSGVVSILRLSDGGDSDNRERVLPSSLAPSRVRPSRYWYCDWLGLPLYRCG